MLRVEWADRLKDYFTHVDFSPVHSAGHFVHYKRPSFTNQEIQRFLPRDWKVGKEDKESITPLT